MRFIYLGIPLALLFISGCQYTAPDYGEASQDHVDTKDFLETTTDLITWSGVVSSIDEDFNLHLETSAPDIPHKEIALAAIEMPIVKDHLLSKEVQQLLSDLLVAKTVRIEMDLKNLNDTDIPRAYVYIDDMLVQDLLVRSGLVFLDGENTIYTSQLMKLQEEATEQLKGIWANRELSESILTGIKENLDEIIKSN